MILPLSDSLGHPLIRQSIECVKPSAITPSPVLWHCACFWLSLPGRRGDRDTTFPRTNLRSSASQMMTARNLSDVTRTYLVMTKPSQSVRWFVAFRTLRASGRSDGAPSMPDGALYGNELPTCVRQGFLIVSTHARANAAGQKKMRSCLF